jgi:hypothetical protein
MNEIITSNKIYHSPYFNKSVQNPTTLSKPIFSQQTIQSKKRKWNNDDNHENADNSNKTSHHPILNPVEFPSDTTTGFLHNYVSYSRYFPPRIVYHNLKRISDVNNSRVTLMNCLSKRIPSGMIKRHRHQTKYTREKQKNEREPNHGGCFCSSDIQKRSSIIELIPASYICHTCQTQLSYAIEHFEHECSIFRHTIKTLIINELQQLQNSVEEELCMHRIADNDLSHDMDSFTDDTTKACCRCQIWIEEYLQRSVRHVCSHLCYLRAYAPYREWIHLQQQLILQQQQQYLDHHKERANSGFCSETKQIVKRRNDEYHRLLQTLDDWTCILLLPDPTNDDIYHSDCFDDSIVLLDLRRAHVDSNSSMERFVSSSCMKKQNILPKIVYYNESLNVVCISRQQLFIELRKTIALTATRPNYDDDSQSFICLRCHDEHLYIGTSDPVIISPDKYPSRISLSKTFPETMKRSKSSTESSPEVFPNPYCQFHVPFTVKYHTRKKHRIYDHTYHNTPAIPALILSSPTRSSCFDCQTRTMDSPFGLLEELFVNDPWKLLICTILLNRTCRIQVDNVLYTFFEKWSSPERLLIEHEQQQQVQRAISLSTKKDDNDILNSTFSNLYKSLCMVLRPLGLHKKRVYGILRFTREFCALTMTKIIENITNGTEHTNENPQLDQQQQKQQQQQQQLFRHQVSCQLKRKEILSLYCCGEYAADAYQIFIQRNINITPNDTFLCNYIDYQRSCI